jgi:hypothetical protein
MLDTVMVRMRCPLRIPLPARQKVNVAPGVKAWADSLGRTLEKAEFSLPRVLFGHNGRVLECQDQIDSALMQCRGILGTIADMPELAHWKASRVDIAWNFEYPASALILAHSSLRVPGIMHGASLFKGGEGVSWRGAKSHKMITLYDKAREMRVPGSVLRAEISLRAEQLTRHLPGDGWRSFESLYQKYRELMASIPKIKSPIRARNFQEAIAQESAEVRARILANLAHKPPRTRRLYKQQIETAAARLAQPFSWAEILPADAPPAAVHVAPRRSVNPPKSTSTGTTNTELK